MMKTFFKITARRLEQPRFVHALALTRAIALGVLAMSCVSTPAYEQVSSAAEVEREAHRRTHVELEEARAELVVLRSKFEALQSSLHSAERDGAQAELGATQLEKERDLEKQLVTELRGELARIGKNLEATLEDQKSLVAEKQAVDSELLEKNQRIESLMKQLESYRASNSTTNEPEDTADLGLDRSR